MRPRLACALGIALAALAAAGCGGSGGSATAPTAGPTTTAARPAPEDARAHRRLVAALRRLQAGSFRATTQMRQTFDASDLPSELRQELGNVGRNTRSTAAVESSRRVSGTAQGRSQVPAIKDQHFVLHDGTVFLSTDGRDWRRLAGSLASLYDQVLGLASQSLARNLTHVRTIGPTRFAGAPAQRYRTPIDPRLILGAMEPLFERFGLDPAILRLGAAEAVYTVRTRDGQVVAQHETVSASMDLSRLPGGVDATLTIRTTLESRLFDHGAPIRVRRPAASGTLEMDAQLAAFLAVP